MRQRSAAQPKPWDSGSARYSRCRRLVRLRDAQCFVTMRGGGSPRPSTDQPKIPIERCADRYPHPVTHVLLVGLGRRRSFSSWWWRCCPLRSGHSCCGASFSWLRRCSGGVDRTTVRHPSHSSSTDRSCCWGNRPLPLTAWRADRTWPHCWPYSRRIRAMWPLTVRTVHARIVNPC